MARDVAHVAPPSDDSVKYTCGVSIGPLTYVITMRSVASAPVGAPLAMSTLDAGARSLRAPVMPSISGRPCTGSKMPGWLTGPTTGRGVLHLAPPSVETDISSNGWWPPDDNVPMPKTYALPALSVRTVH